VVCCIFGCAELAERQRLIQEARNGLVEYLAGGDMALA